MKALKFSASWCGPCKGLAKVIETAKDKITVPIEEYDIDTCGSLSGTHQIRSVPTMILLNDAGAEIKRKVGGMDEKALLEFLKG
jgi:thioredoxin-like negative regulator of GroEL